MKHLISSAIFIFLFNSTFGVLNFSPRTPGYTYYRINGNQNFTDNIVIQNRAILVLECGIFKITKGKKITIEKGGQLFLSYATVTHESDNAGTSTTVNTANNWMGIEVLGDNGENQLNQFNQLPPCYNYGCFGYSDTIDFDINARPQYKQGYLAMYKSKIRYSNFGVTIGKILTNSPFSDIGEGGGIFTSIESSFENNHYRHLYFASYSFQMNVAIVIKNNFNYDHLTNQWPTFQHMHRDLIARDNTFKYNFENNNFNVYTLFNNFIGIELYQSYMRLNYNTFKYHMAGVVLENYFGGSWNNIHYLENNTFDQCQVGVDVGGVNKVRIDNNTFKLCTFKREINGGPTFMTYFNSTTNRPYSGFTPNQNGTVGVYSSSGSYNLQTFRNKFSAQLTPLSNQDGAIVTWMNGNLASGFFKNTSNRMVTGFRSIENNQGYQVQCNSFSASRFSDIFNDQITGIGLSNSLMSNQGSSTKPTRNIHTRFTGNGRFDLVNENTNNYSGSNRLRYYWKLGNNSEFPGNISTSSTIDVRQNSGQNSCGVNLEIDSYNPEEGCGIKNRIPSELTIYNEIKDDLNELLAGGISSEEEDEYNQLLHDFDISMNDMVDHYISNYMEFGYDVTDSIKLFLKAHNTLNSQVHLIQLYLSIDSFTYAENLLDSLSAHYSGDDFIDDYVEYYTLISSYLQNHNNSWLFSHFNNFKTIADSNGYMSSNALSVAQYIAYSDSTNDYFNEMFSYRFLPSVTDSIITDTIAEEITVYPIPFSSNLSIDIENFTSNNRNFTIILKDLTGIEKFNSNLVVVANDLNTLSEMTGSISIGLYILQVYEDGILIDSRLVNK